jgi:hypothetical protein
MKTRIGTALLLGALSLYLTPAMAAAGEDHAIEHLVIETASTPAQHTALAKHFHAKAEDARAEARSHEEMAKVYGMGPHKGTETAEMQRHCKKLAELSNAQADEYEALAKSHEAEAKKP